MTLLQRLQNKQKCDQLARLQGPPWPRRRLGQVPLVLLLGWRCTFRGDPAPGQRRVLPWVSPLAPGQGCRQFLASTDQKAPVLFYIRTSPLWGNLANKTMTSDCQKLIFYQRCLNTELIIRLCMLILNYSPGLFFFNKMAPFQ